MMAMISKNPLRNDVLERVFNLFFEVLGKRDNKEEFIDIASNILSSSEKIMIAKRIAILYLLLKKIDYQIICEILKVSASTVFKFRPIVESETRITPVLKLILTTERVTQFFEEIFLTLYGPGSYGTNWSSAWKAKIELERKKLTGI